MGKEYIVLNVVGGIGKNIMTTAVIKPLKEKYPELKIIVVASWPEVFMYSPYIHRVFKLGTTPYFYQDYIEGGKSLIMAQDPYMTNSYINGQKHFIECLFDLCDLEYNGEMPSLNINYSFVESAFSNFKRERKLLLIHSNGGGVDEKRVRYSWARDIPRFFVQNIVDHYKNDYNILQICKSEDQVVEGASPILPGKMSFLEMLCIAKVSDKRLLIDSCVQHACAAWNLPSTVIWNATASHMLGYEMHDNIYPTAPSIENHKLPNSFLQSYSIWGSPLECPYITNDIYDFDRVTGSINNQ
jgi:hypothetical protein